MIKKSIFVIALCMLPFAAIAQPGPGPVPDPWTVNGNAISYDGCVLVPVAAVQGCKGNGTLSANGVFLAPSAAGGATFNIPQGAAPTTPANGDIWTTASGIFVRINGGTVGPLTGPISGSFAATSPLSVSFPSSIVTYACPTCNTTALTNARLAKTANYTLDVTDCGKTLALGGSAFFTLTISAASGYDATCQITILNTDSGRGKRISPNGVTSFILYPTQTMVLYNSNNVWNVNKQNRWRIPGSLLPIYVNYGTGDDLNDGLVSGSPKKTITGCLTVVAQELDFNFLPQSTVSCNLAAGSLDLDGVHFSTHALVGAQGGAAILIQGDGGQATISTAGPVPLAFFVNATVQLKNLILTNSSGACLQAGYHTFVDVLSGMTFFTCTGNAQVVATDGAIIQFNNDYAVNGGGTSHWLASQGGQILAGAITVTAPPTFNYTVFAYSSALSSIISSATFTGFSGTAGIKAQSDLNSIVSATGGCASFPGLNAPVTTSGGQCP